MTQTCERRSNRVNAQLFPSACFQHLPERRSGSKLLPDFRHSVAVLIPLPFRRSAVIKFHGLITMPAVTDCTKSLSTVHAANNVNGIVDERHTVIDLLCNSLHTSETSGFEVNRG